MNGDGEKPRYWGKYPACVTDNRDPEGRGRVRFRMASALGGWESTWAEACVPLSGAPDKSMGAFWVPPRDAAVWVEFVDGDANKPVWSGCRLESSRDVPAPASKGRPPPEARIVLQTVKGHSVVLSDVADEGIVLRAASGAELRINDQGITIKTPGGASIQLSDSTVSVNKDGLVVR